MKWLWKLPDWPKFTFDQLQLKTFEADFLYLSGMLSGSFQHINDETQKTLIIDLASDESLNTSEIEGEHLNRDSIQSSIKRHLGLPTDKRTIPAAEDGVALVTMDVLESYSVSLTHKTLSNWHKLLMKGRRDLQDSGAYRTHLDPMQIVSGEVYAPKVHYVAPPSEIIEKEMKAFILWFNDSAPEGKNPLKPLARAGICHLYFLAIHPFEDGNGRIGRALVQKVLSQSLKQMTMTALSAVINDNKKAYYTAIKATNLSLDITDWLYYFSKLILEAQSHTLKMVNFIVEKGKLFARLTGQLNIRQEKALNRMFKEGSRGFIGGLSAENYISITKTSRATATRDLKDLVTKGVLNKTGKLKKTRYSLNM